MAARTRLAVAVAAGVVGVSALLAARTGRGSDYPLITPGTDGAGPQIDALVHLRIASFFAHQSFLGPVSLVLRAPFAALSRLDHGTVLAQYRFGTFVCLVALGLAGLAVAVLAAARPSGLWHGALLIALLMLAPPTHNAIRAGHPEELLTTAFVLGATLAAVLGRPWLAVALVGLAIASKPWGALAIGPVAIASSDRVRVAAAGAAVGVVLIAPMALANTSAFRTAARGANEIHNIQPLDAWWPISAKPAVTPTGVHVTLRHLPQAVRHGVRPGLFVLAAVLSLLLARRGRASLDVALLLLALIFLLRGVLDPGNHPYYHVPFIAALGSWEVLARKRPPALALVVSLLLSQTFIGRLAPDNDLIAWVYLAWSLPLAAYLAFELRRA